MADVGIDPFGEHNKTDLHPDDTGESIPLVNPGGESTFEPEHGQETSFGGGKTQEKGSPILMLTVCTRSYLSIIAEPWMQPVTITLDMKACGLL